MQIITMAVHQYAPLWFPALTPPPLYAFTARVGVLHTLSRGWVRLRSADPRAHPHIGSTCSPKGPIWSGW